MPMISHLREEYPLEELCRARDEFWYCWNRALTNSRSSTVSRVVRNASFLSHAHPPHIYMHNTWPYPFHDSDTPFCPSSKTFLRSGRIPPQPQTSSTTATAPKRHHIDQPEFGRLAEQAVSEIKRKHLSGVVDEETEEEKKAIYVCDACETQVPDSKAAKEHLLSTNGNHVTCSKYLVDEEGCLELALAREVSVNGGKADEDFGWTKEDVVVFCPSCYLVMADKIQCGHHHETCHTVSNHLEVAPANYAYGRVLESMTLTFANPKRPSCSTCGAHLPSLTALATHWFRERPSCSPFKGLETSTTPLIITLECLHCGRQRDTTVFGHGDGARGASAEAIKRAANFLGESMLTHLRGKPQASVSGFRVRFVQLPARDDEARRVLPPSGNQSQSAQLLFSLREIKRTQALLRPFQRCQRRKALLAKVNADLERISSAAQNVLNICDEAE